MVNWHYTIFDSKERKDLEEEVLAKTVDTVEEKMETAMVESGAADVVAVRKVEEQLRTRNQNNNTYKNHNSCI